MAESLLAIKKRLNTVQSIRKITKAMKLIASSRYTKIRGQFNASIDYEKAMRYCMQTCVNSVDFSKANLPTCMRQNNGTRTLYIFVSSTLGLCGAYNYNLYKFANSVMNKNSDVIFLGEKGYRHFKDNVNKAFDEYLNLAANLSFEKTNQFRHWLDKLYLTNNYKAVYIIYTKYINSLLCEPIKEQLLPLVNTHQEEEVVNTVTTFDPNPEKVSDLIVPHYLDSVLYRCFLESNMSEQTSRRNSMDNATNSADKLISALRLKFNKIRQQKITQEITEVISGSNSR